MKNLKKGVADKATSSLPNQETADKATKLLLKGRMTEAIEAVNGPDVHVKSSRLDISSSDDFSKISISDEIDNFYKKDDLIKRTNRIDHKKRELDYKRQRLTDVIENRPVGPGGNMC